MGKRSREKKERRLQENNSHQQKIAPKRIFGLERVYLSFIEWGTYLVLFSPLIVVRSFFFPFVSPKTIFFRIVVEIIFIAYIFLAVSNPRYRPKINILTISIIVFLAITVLTSFTGINLERSFWSTFERVTGLLTFFHLFVFFIILTSCFKERKYWERILTVSILVGVLLSAYILLSDDLSARGGGTIGNTSFMSAYLLFDIFFAIILFLTKTGGWRIFYGAVLTVLLAALFFNVEPTRGAIGSFMGGIFILGLGYMIFSGKQLVKRLAPIVLILAVLAGIGISQTSFFKAKMMDIKEIPGEARKVVWGMGFEGWKERPWLGWGQENFNIPFAKHFDPELPLSYDVWYDRVHNVVLDTAVTSGILGLLSYLAVFAAAIFGLLRICSKAVGRKNVFFSLGMISLLSVYFAQNIWVFDMISSYLMFFLSLAFIYFLIEEAKPQTEEMKEAGSPFPGRRNGDHPRRFTPFRDKSLTEFTSKKVYSFFGVCLIVAALWAFYYGNIQPARSSRYIVQGIASPLERAIPAFQKAIEVSPMAIFEAPEQLSKKMTVFTFDTKQNKEFLKNGFELAAEEMKKAINENPEDFRFYLLLGRHYNDFYFLTRDEEKLKQAEIFLEKAIELSPGNQQGYWGLAQARLSQGRGEEAVELMQKSIDIEPRFSRSHWYLAMTYRFLGKNELALEKVKEAEKVGYDWEANLGDLKRVIEIYQNLKDNENLVPLYLLAIEKDPTNAQFQAGLSIAYANLGQFDKAREWGKKAIELNPDFTPQLEEFLESLPGEEEE